MSSADIEEKVDNNAGGGAGAGGGGGRALSGGCACCSCCDTYALKLNQYIEKAFNAIGWIIGDWPYLILGLVLLFLSLCCIGYIFVSVETDIFSLWTPTDSPVFAEKEFINFWWGEKDYGLVITTGYAKEGEDTNILTDEYLQQWFQIHIDLATRLPTKEYEYTALDNSQKSVTFGYFAEKYGEPQSLSDLGDAAKDRLGPTSYATEVIPLCRAASQSPAEAQFIMPCYMVTVIDCFSEGGYFFPWENYLKNTQLSSLIPGNMFTYDRDSFVGLSSIEIGERLAPSCAGFSGVLAPPNLIYGGATRLNASQPDSTIIDLKSFQIGQYTDSPHSIARKVKIASGRCKYTATFGIDCPAITKQEFEEAEEFLNEWLLDYIEFMKEYAEELKNDDTKLFNLVFYTPRTTGDLLREASSADFGLLAIAYIAMIIFASLTAIKPTDWFLSRSEASFAGVLLVLFAVVATIGLGSFLQIPLSPNIVQVLPFIALGFGVDDMFVLLFSFKFRERASVQEMIAETTRIAGSSVALTSLANFLGFLIGTTMVLPDVARFATFGAIVVLLNFIAVIFGFTAVLTLVARRMKNAYNDWSFIFCWATFTRAVKVSSQKPSSLDTSVFDPLFDWLTKTYTRAVLLVAFVALILTGLYGCTLISPGLPLADIVPDQSYTSDFLRIRELYYHSYPETLYTDAQGFEHKPIDWENKFAQWLDATADIRSMSPAVSRMDVHSFWAESLQSYLTGRHESYLTGVYEFGATFDIEEELADEPVYQVSMCYDDADLYCSSLPRLYSDTSSSLFNCLLVNYQLANLQSECGAWVEQMYLATVDTAVARQVYVTSYESESGVDVAGLYVRPSTNDIRVYIKQPHNDGYIYQVDCDSDVCPWRLLDAEFNVLYVGDATAVDMEAPQAAAPAQGGWRDAATGMVPVAITHTYYDFFVAYEGNLRDSSQFMAGDFTPETSFSFSNAFRPSDEGADASNACTRFEVMRLLMSASDAYTRVDFRSDIGDGATCNAILEASEICVGIRDESFVGSVYCGSVESNANRNLWYVGSTADGLYQIMSSSDNNGDAGVLTASVETFDNCDDPSAWVENTNFTYNYLKPCGGISDFGGFGISENGTDSIASCNAGDQVIDLQCHAFSECNDLKACFNDFRRISIFDPGSDCDGVVDTYDIKERQGESDYTLSTGVNQCAFKNYLLLSDCCRTAVNTQIIALPHYSCAMIEALFGDTDGTAYPAELKAVCQVTDKCEYDEEFSTCTEVSGGDNVFDDCNLLITGENAQCSLEQLNMSKAMVRAGEQQPFYDCMNDGDTGVTAVFSGTRRIKLSSSDTCEATFNALQSVYADCLYPVDSFYDLSLGKYDYAMCTDAELAAAEISYNQTCGATNDDTVDQLECLADEIHLFDDGCCKKAVQQIFNEHSYSFTNECEADVAYFCAVYGITSAGDALLAAVNNVCFGDVCPGVLCMTAIGTAMQSAQLSPKCHEAMVNCEENGNWPVTVAAQTASIPCDTGFGGQQTRTCLMDSIPAQWGAVDTSSCVALSCPEILAADDTDYEQYWPETPVHSVYKIQGGFVNSANPANLDAFTITQISSTLQAESDDTCDPSAGNIWYARRACMLNPYNSSQAQWQTPLVECKPMATWDNVQEQTICDFVTEAVTAGLAENVAFAAGVLGINDWATSLAATKKANLIFAIPWTMLDGEYDAETQKDLSKTYCTLQSDNCAAFTYDSMFQISYFFDYCPTLTSADMNGFGIVPEIMASDAYTMTEPTPPYPSFNRSFDGPLTALAYLLSLQYNMSISKPMFLFWAGYDDPIVEEFAPQYSDLFDMSIFADRHTTYIAPLNQVEFIASWCSLRTAIMYHAAGTEQSADIFVAPTQAWDANGIPDPECFNNTLWLFFIDPTGNGVIKRDKVVFEDESQVASLKGFDAVRIKTTSNGLIVVDIDDDEVAVEFIIDLRNRLDQWAEDGLYVIPGGLVINLFSQYVNVSSYLVSNLIYVSIAIFLCGLVFLLNPIAVIVAVLCNTAMVIEVYGFADWFGLRINGVLVLNIIIAVALTMEFTAHIGRAFVLSYVTEKDRKSSIALPFSNDGQIRMKKTLREMFTPVSLGALTTLIGVAPIAGAQFPYFRQYYFTLYVMIVLFGWLNGVIFQVVILSFIPPKPFVHSPFSRLPQRQRPQKQVSDSAQQPLVQHQELQEMGTAGQGRVVTELPGTDADGDGGEELAVEEDFIQTQHTRTIEDAP